MRFFIQTRMIVTIILQLYDQLLPLFNAVTDTQCVSKYQLYIVWNTPIHNGFYSQPYCWMIVMSTPHTVHTALQWRRLLSKVGGITYICFWLNLQTVYAKAEAAVTTNEWSLLQYYIDLFGYFIDQSYNGCRWCIWNAFWVFEMQCYHVYKTKGWYINVCSCKSTRHIHYDSPLWITSWEESFLWQLMNSMQYYSF